MDIGVPKEIKDNENRVGMVPAGVQTLTDNGHNVYIEEGAGTGSGISDDEYRAAGADLVSQDEAWDADMVVKIKEPLEPEYDYLEEGKVVFTYFHLAADRGLTEEVIDSGVTAIAYETVEKDGDLPLLDPMSAVAGKMAAMEGAYYLAEHEGGKGTLITGLDNVDPGNVLVIGGGTVGTNAAELAANMGADVTVLDIDEDRITELDQEMPDNVTADYSNPDTVASYAEEADVLVGAVLVPGASAPTVVSEEHVQSMEDGSVIVDVAIDQGGCVETVQNELEQYHENPEDYDVKPFTHSNPTFTEHDVVHYAVMNMPGAYARTATNGITTATTPYIQDIADKGWKQAMKDDSALRKGLNAHAHTLTNEAVAEAFDISWTAPEELL